MQAIVKQIISELYEAGTNVVGLAMETQQEISGKITQPSDDGVSVLVNDIKVDANSVVSHFLNN